MIEPARRNPAVWGGVRAVHALGSAVGVGLLIYAWWVTVSRTPPQFDTWNYYVAWQGGLYDQPWHAPGSYPYPPVLAQVYAPLTLLPWPVFVGLWMGGLAVLMAWLFGPLVAGLLATMIGPLAGLGVAVFGPSVPFAGMALPFGNGFLVTGNITLLIAAGLVLSFRHPAAWSVVFLTKVAPGVSIVWHAVRRDWPALRVAILATAAICAVSFLISPGAWIEWIGRTLNTDPAPLKQWVWLDWPLSIRIVLAAGIAAAGGLLGWRWTVFLAAFVALPAIWMTSELIVLAGFRSFMPGWRPGTLIGNDQSVAASAHTDLVPDRRPGIGDSLQPGT